MDAPLPISQNQFFHLSFQTSISRFITFLLPKFWTCNLRFTSCLETLFRCSELPISVSVKTLFSLLLFVQPFETCLDEPEVFLVLQFIWYSSFFYEYGTMWYGSFEWATFFVEQEVRYQLKWFKINPKWIKPWSVDRNRPRKFFNISQRFVWAPFAIGLNQIKNSLIRIEGHH